MKIEISGPCLNSEAGRVEVIAHDRFALFIHEDSLAPVAIPLNPDNILVENHLVSLARPLRVDIVEHLFSALYGLSLFNVRVDVFGNELPFLDGSSKHYTEKLKTLVTDKKRKSAQAERRFW